MHSSDKRKDAIVIPDACELSTIPTPSTHVPLFQKNHHSDHNTSESPLNSVECSKRKAKHTERSVHKKRKGPAALTSTVS